MSMVYGKKTGQNFNPLFEQAFADSIENIIVLDVW